MKFRPLHDRVLIRRVAAEGKPPPPRTGWMDPELKATTI